MTPSTRLYLVRHGITAANREMRFVGDRDDPLTREGESQATGLAGMLEAVGLSAVYASPARRAQSTAAPLGQACRLVVQTEPKLKEMAFGDWEGLHMADIRARDDGDLLGRWLADPELAPPGGESLAAVQRRLTALADNLVQRHRGESIALVTHIGPIKALLYAALGTPLANARRMMLDPASVQIIDWGKSPTVRLVNATPNLDQAARPGTALLP
ncbi:MAG: histidine phosphatase family protein [Acidobacteriota bacterium]